MIDIKELNDFLNGGLIVSQNHPRIPNLSIYNYSNKCQYEKAWTITTKACRGLVLDANTNAVVARPFPKFFNLSEHLPSDIPNLPFEVYDKMDGSLGILFYYNGWHLATRGSFVSEQAIRGKEMLDDLNLYDYLDSDYTYLFEIIYDKNRIVCHYDFEDMVLLGAVRVRDGYEMPYGDLPKGFRLVKKYDGINDYNVLKDMVEPNAEGFVVRFSNGFRIKVKGEEYVRLHRIVTNVTTVRVWEHLKDDFPLDELLDNVPDEFYKAIRDTVDSLRDKYNTILNRCSKAHFTIMQSLGLFSTGCYLRMNPRELRKSYAKEALAYTDISHILFRMWDRKDYSDLIWDLVKPKSEKIGF